MTLRILFVCFAFLAGTFSASSAKAKIPIMKQKIVYGRKPSSPLEILKTDELLAAARCSTDVAHVLDHWGAIGKWKLSNVDMDGAHVYRGRTSWSGVWIEARRYANDEVTAFRITNNSLTTATWRNANCTPSLRVDTSTQKKNFAYGRFSDHDLDTLLKQGGKGMIYIWSPHMNLSMIGLKEAVAIAKELKIHIEVMVDGSADPRALKDALQSQHIDARYFQAVDSLDILMRHTTLHYPSLLLFKDGEVLDFMLPGYEAKAPLMEIVSSRLGM
ncbi:MAG: hypothetical protein ABIR96_03880 [Bdellovibrionota bacterium]